jgi:[CysO sulfur-carrier protein]-S-L-cysteine hydrolase
MSDSLIQRLVETGKTHYPKEFGGILVGDYSTDFRQLNITDSILPRTKTFNATPTLFERNSKGMERELHKFYKRNPPKYYIGEWHTHPDNLPFPSITDLQAMQSIVDYPKVEIKNPVLLIIGYSIKSTEIALYIYTNNRLYNYEYENSNI